MRTYTALLKAVQKEYPHPKSGLGRTTADDYCVGGAFCLYMGYFPNRRFPSAQHLALAVWACQARAEVPDAGDYAPYWGPYSEREDYKRLYSEDYERLYAMALQVIAYNDATDFESAYNTLLQMLRRR